MTAAAGFDLVCVSHLWWDWVWQRPQQLLTRIATDHPVLYVEEPRIEIGERTETFELVEVAPNVEVARLAARGDRAWFDERLRRHLEVTTGRPDFRPSPETTNASLLFESDLQPRLEQEVRDLVAQRRQRPLVLWLYTPVVVSWIDLLEPDLVVYDVMDELTMFRFAPERLRRQEEELLARADLVFGGGPSLYASKRSRHPDVHLFPSGVDRAHFARALDPALPIPEGLPAWDGPRIGFYGVIDERTNLELLEAMADLRPGWQWLMVGPVLKIEEDTLPRRDNIHYAGMQTYDKLPGWLKAFDVAMMPFALNEATRFISPTKTLEYMAGQKPIVSTPIPDIVGLYGAVVRIAADARSFVGEVEKALAESPMERADRNARERQLLRHYEWSRIAGDMERLITERLARKLAPR